MELQYLQLQINPHFLTNCVSMIRNLLIIERYELAERFSGLLSQYIRDNLTKATRVSLEKEIRNVVNYVELQKIRYEERVKLTLSYDESLGEMYIPNMMIQTFVENSVKHQISPEEVLEIRVSAERRQECLYILIEDSGEGFKQEILQMLKEGEVIVRENVEHVGIHNIVKRLRIMYKEQASIEFSNKEHAGARVEIWIPGEM